MEDVINYELVPLARLRGGGGCVVKSKETKNVVPERRDRLLQRM